jgi:hypothetical protein
MRKRKDCYQMNSVTSSGRTLMNRQRNQWKVTFVREMSQSEKWSVSSGSFSERRYAKIRSSTRIPNYMRGNAEKYEFIGEVAIEEIASHTNLSVESKFVIHMRKEKCRNEIHGLAITPLH